MKTSDLNFSGLAGFVKEIWFAEVKNINLCHPWNFNPRRLDR